LLVPAALAGTIVIKPSSDGSLNTCEGCLTFSDEDYLAVYGTSRGRSSSPPRHMRRHRHQKAVLSVNATQCPVGRTVDVYGYGTSEGGW
jgi:hypothetical protein